MSNETDLDWLARNVHEWPLIAPKVIPDGDKLFEFGATFCADHVDIYGRFPGCGYSITKAEWLARRAELQNKPSWALAPEWAEWLAQDEDGEWKWLAGLPGKYVDGWTAVKIKGCCEGMALGDWRDTLEKRPEQDEFEPFVSVEDNQEQDMTQQQEVKQDNGWYDRGELPPVGARVNVDGPGLVYGDGERDCEVLTHVEDTAVVRMSYGLGCFQSHVLSPSRTERDVLIDLLGLPRWFADQTLREELADAILAAGFSLRGK